MLFYVAHGCPNCGGMISDERLSKGLPCENCLKEKDFPLEKEDLKEITEILRKKGTLKDLEIFARVEEEIAHFKKIFREAQEPLLLLFN